MRSGRSSLRRVERSLPIDQFRDDEEISVVGLADIVDGDDVGMIESRDDASFVEEALSERRIEPRAECNFDGDIAPGV